MESDPTTDLSPPNAIRVETALSRYPVHRLAKRGDVTIDIQEHSDGELTTRWEVSHNSKYGQPGPLAYKLDTLVSLFAAGAIIGAWAGVVRIWPVRYSLQLLEGPPKPFVNEPESLPIAIDSLFELRTAS